MEGLPVTLIVKAPNQQIEDQTIKCELTWTIQRLKGYLSEVYPCKPKTEEQKLIYSGQLLSDTVVLKDVLRRYEGQDTHTVHLVCSMKHSPPRPSRASEPPAREPANENLRQRHPAPPNPPQGPPQLQPHFSQAYYWDNTQNNPWNNMAYQWGNNYNSFPGMGTAPANVDSMAFASSQLAWMQQMQAQYMQLYTQMLQTGAVPTGNPPADASNQQQPAQNVEQLNANANQNVPAPAPPNQVNNILNELDNWDWLDWFYMMSRVIVMLAVVYFYSSPLRFLTVCVCGFMAYLYQIGYFHALANNNNAENANNNNNQVPLNNNNADEGNAPQDPAGAESEDPQPNQLAEHPQEARQSILAITWTVVTSFLTSLFPETPNTM